MPQEKKKKQSLRYTSFSRSYDPKGGTEGELKTGKFVLFQKNCTKMWKSGEGGVKNVTFLLSFFTKVMLYKVPPYYCYNRRIVWHTRLSINYHYRAI